MVQCIAIEWSLLNLVLIPRIHFDYTSGNGLVTISIQQLGNSFDKIREVPFGLEKANFPSLLKVPMIGLRFRNLYLGNIFCTLGLASIMPTSG